MMEVACEGLTALQHILLGESAADKPRIHEESAAHEPVIHAEALADMVSADTCHVG